MMRRWRCPFCNDGKLAPGKARRDDVRTYCLSCSATSGRLVRRVCDARVAEAAKREEQRAEAAKRQAERNAVQRRLDRAVEAERMAAKRAPWTAPDDRIALVGRYFQQWSALKAWECDLSDVQVHFRRGHAVRGGVGTSGCANGTDLHMTIGADLADALDTLLHEMAHSATFRWLARTGHTERYRRRDPHSAHGLVWRGFFLAAVREVTGKDVVIDGTTVWAIQTAVLATVRAWLTEQKVTNG